MAIISNSFITKGPFSPRCFSPGWLHFLHSTGESDCGQHGWSETLVKKAGSCHSEKCFVLQAHPEQPLCRTGWKYLILMQPLHAEVHVSSEKLSLSVHGASRKQSRPCSSAVPCTFLGLILTPGPSPAAQSSRFRDAELCLFHLTPMAVIAGITSWCTAPGPAPLLTSAPALQLLWLARAGQDEPWKILTHTAPKECRARAASQTRVTK